MNLLNVFIAASNVDNFQIISSYVIYGLMIIAIIVLIGVCIKSYKKRKK
jgi:hypothetical protein